MGSLSVSIHRGFVHWQELMVVVSLLIFCSLPTTDQVSIVSTFAAKGQDVLLHVNSKPPEAVAFVWYKGEGIDNNNVIAFSIPTLTHHLSGPKSDREQIIDDGSLLLKKVTMMDAGIYTIVAYLPDSEKEIGFGQLDVYEPLRAPTLLASSYKLKEDEDNVALTCYTSGDSVHWVFNDRYLKFTARTKLSADGRKVTINPVKREDAGEYRCKASNPVSRVESQPIHLYVLYE